MYGGVVVVIKFFSLKPFLGLVVCQSTTGKSCTCNTNLTVTVDFLPSGVRGRHQLEKGSSINPLYRVCDSKLSSGHSLAHPHTFSTSNQMEETRPRSHSVLQIRSSGFQVRLKPVHLGVLFTCQYCVKARASKLLSKMANLGARENRIPKEDKNPYMKQTRSMDLSHKPFISQPALGLHAPENHEETDNSSRSVSPYDASCRPLKRISSRDAGQSMRSWPPIDRPQTARDQELNSRHGTSTETSQDNHDTTDTRWLTATEILAKDEPFGFSLDQRSIRHGSTDVKSMALPSPERITGEGTSSTEINNGQALSTSTVQTSTSTTTRYPLPRQLSNIPPPSLNRVGSPRHTPSLVIRHPPMPLLHLPTLPLPTPSQPVRVRSRTRLRSIPALPAQGPGDHEIDTDHENAGLGDSEDEETSDLHMNSNIHDGRRSERNDRANLSLDSTESSRSNSRPPSLSERLVLPIVDTSRIDLSFLDRPYRSTSEERKGREMDETPTAGHPLDYFSPRLFGRSPSQSPARTPRPGDTQFSPFSTIQSSRDNNQVVGSRMPQSPSRSMYRHPSKSLVDIVSSSKKGAIASAATILEEESLTQVVQVKGKLRESSDAPTVVPSESTLTERQKRVVESPAKDGLRRNRSMPTFNPTSIPPPYPSFPPHPLSKFTAVVPREEEGMERLPSYTNSIFLTAIMPRKMEFTAPGIQAKDRKWRRVLCVLEGTVFRVFHCPRKAAGVGLIGDWWEKTVGVGDISMTQYTSPGNRIKPNQRVVEGPAKLDLATDTDTPQTPWTSRPEISESTSRPATALNRNLATTLPEPSRQTQPSSHSYSRSQNAATDIRSNQSSSLATDHSRSHRNHTALFSSDVSVAVGSPPSSSSSSQFASPRSAEAPTSNPAQTDLIRAYSMQHAESGLGNDYLKRKNVIRLRLEGEQFLLQAIDVTAVVEWIEVREKECLPYTIPNPVTRLFKLLVISLWIWMSESCLKDPSFRGSFLFRCRICSST